jgi:EmrB/QacA subfamily drug resistance transporter
MALVVVCLGQLMIVVDTTVVNVALPSIQRDLGFSQPGLAWVVDSYLIAFGSLLLLSGRLGDLIGRKKVFLGGIVLFTLASIACGLANSEATLIAARFLQGVGAAAGSAVIVAIIATEFPEPRERTTAMSVYTLVVSGGASLGLLLGGVVTESIDWHWIFFVNVPVGVIALVLGWSLIAENEGIGIRHGVDVLGSLMVTAALMTGIYAVVTSGDYALLSGHTLGFAGMAVALLAAFGVRQARIANPIVPMRVLRLPTVVNANAVRGLMVVGFYSLFFLGALYLQNLHGFDAVQIGLAFLPQTLTIALMSTGPTARLVNRFGPKPLVIAGLSLSIAGLLVFASASADAAYFPTFFVAFLVLGLGAGLSFMPLVTLAMAEVSPRDAGLASAMVSVATQLSAAIGIAALSAVATARTHALTAAGSSSTDALIGGYRLAFLLGAAVVGAGVLLALRTPQPAAATEAEVVPAAVAE